MAREIKSVQSYQDRLLKLLPSEIIGAYIVLQGIIPQEHAKWGTLLIATVLFLITPLYLLRIQNVHRPSQIAVTTISFVVWLYSLGGPFQYWGVYEAWISSVILVLWTISVPIIFQPKDQPLPAA